jgi:D-psicose/D-tagatose/L-ribulose 3-epimerase
MYLAVSHIAWPQQEEASSLALLRDLGLCDIELAPLRAFGNPLVATETVVRERAAWYRKEGFRIGSFQALLFGTNGLDLFGCEEARQRMKEMLIVIGKLAGWAGAGPMVFGSPKNRLRGKLDHETAVLSAAPFFREIGDACAEAGSCLVIEANPEAYGADFCTRLSEAADLVRAVDSPGFGLHLDAGGMALSGEDFEPILREAAGLLRHVHASQPNLSSFALPNPIHTRISRVLKDIGYQGGVAIEMRAQPEGMAAVDAAVRAVREIYFQ